MKTVVIAGGTRGIGKGLALRLLRDGDRVTVIGNTIANGQALHAEAERLHLADRLLFVQGDLSSLAGTIAVANQLTARHATIDTLVFSAGSFNSRRVETAEGLERTFSLYVLSRYVLAELLLEPLRHSANPLIFGLCGTGGIPAGGIHWDDLQLRHGYSSFRATMQGARANDLLGAGFRDRHPDSSIRYVLYNPVFVDTGMADHFTNPSRFVVRTMAKLFATPVDKAVDPIVDILAAESSEPFAAFRKRTAIDVKRKEFDHVTAFRFYDAMEELTASLANT